MKILVIPTTDWVKHPVPNRLNFIFDSLADNHEVHVCHLKLKKFHNLPERGTKCTLQDMGGRSLNDPSLYYIFNIISHARSLKRIVNDHKIDLIVSANILPSYMANLVSPVPIVYDYLDHFEESAAIYYPNSIFGKIAKKIVGRIVAENLKRASVVITVTEYFEEILRKKGVTNIEVIPNGVDTKVMKPIPLDTAKKGIDVNGTVLGYAGSLEHWIDLETVISGLPEIAKHIPDIKLVIVGPSLFTDYVKKLHTLSRKLNVHERIVYTGAVKYSDLNKYISAFDICLNPRKPMKMNRLTIGGKVFNYLACGKPVLSSNMEFLNKLFSTKDGIYCYNDRSEFVSQVSNILDSEHNSTHYREIALRYDWGILAKRYEKILTSCL
jgi:glycosyltransferase involved in cell wall biosynthesis